MQFSSFFFSIDHYIVANFVFKFRFQILFSTLKKVMVGRLVEKNNLKNKIIVGRSAEKEIWKKMVGWSVGVVGIRHIKDTATLA